MFHCTSYPATNLGDFSTFFGDALNPGGDPVWMQLGYPDKGAWKRAGRPTGNAIVGTPLPTNNAIIGTPLPADPAGPNSAGVPGTDKTKTPGSLLSGIPTTYLLIGGAMVLLMVMKK